MPSKRRSATASSAPAAPLTDPITGPARLARRAVSAQFLVMGMTGGMWMARVPAAKAQAHLSDGTLGAALFAVPIGLVLGAALAERLVDRVGSAWVARTAGVGSCLLLVAPGLASSLPELMAALLVWGIASGTLDVAQNAQGLRVEAAYGRPVMTSMHAFYSLPSGSPSPRRRWPRRARGAGGRGGARDRYI
jgi:MFS family permease